MIRVAITQGDYNGVGPEVTLKALGDERIPELFTPIYYADRRVVEEAIAKLGIEIGNVNYIKQAGEAKQGRINVVDIEQETPNITPGAISASAGKSAVNSLERAVKDVMEGRADLLVTAPISKEAVQSETFHFPGHTEYLASKAEADGKSLMILFEDKLRVALVTTHLPIAEISKAITKESVEHTIRKFNESLRKDFGMTRPRIAVLSLNPHNGDNGLLGDEEQNVIKPAMDVCNESGILTFGPFAADGFFGSEAWLQYDGVVAMYHDQGLAPFKALAQSTGVNFTAGLPFVRTSPDHGTAFDIAWQGTADPQSMREAIYNAIDIYRRRHSYEIAGRNPLKRMQPPKGREAKDSKERGEDKVKKEDKTGEKSGEKSGEK